MIKRLLCIGFLLSCCAIVWAQSSERELLLLQQRDAVGPVSIHCVNLLTGQEAVEFTKEEEDATPLCLADTIGKYLYEPNAALMKAGCFKVLAQRYE